MALTRLPTVIPMRPDRPPVGGPDHPMRLVTIETATDASSWTSVRAREVEALFDSVADTWMDRNGPEYLDSLVDPLARGGPFIAGPCIEVGSGPGIVTPALRARFDDVISLDLSAEMLAIASSASPRVRADASTLPVRSRSAAVVVLVNMFLFAHEVDRVLAEGGALLWVNTLGDVTPIYLPADDVLRALPGRWDGMAADAGWGTWLVARRAE